MRNRTAVVLGDLDLVRALGESGVPVILCTTREDEPAARSRYVERTVRIPDPDADPAGALRALLAQGGEGEERRALFYQGDSDLLLVSRNRRAIAGRFRVLLPDEELVEATVDKLAFDALARRAGLPVPETRLLGDGARPVQVALQGWSAFPCIVKPALRHGWFESALCRSAGGARKAIRIGSREELSAMVPALEAHGAPLLLQACIEGGEDRVVSYHAYVREDGARIAEFTGRKLRTWSRACGMSTAVEITADPEVRALGRDVLERLSFRGVVKLDFKRDLRTGELFLLEVNPRFNLWHWPGAVAGANIPRLVYDDLYEPFSSKPAAARPGVRFVALREDVRALREYRAAGEITTLGWLRSVATAHAVRELRLTDPLPGLLEALQAARRLVRRRPA